MYSFKFIFLVFVCLTASTSYINAEPLNAELDIKRQFDLYRTAIKETPLSLSKYFSKVVNEEWLGYLFKDRSEEGVLATLRTVKSRASFGKRIVSVYSFTVTIIGSDKATADIIYKNSEGKGPFLYSIGYVKRNGLWKINQVTSDTTKPGSGFKGKVIQEYEQINRS